MHDSASPRIAASLGQVVVYSAFFIFLCGWLPLHQGSWAEFPPPFAREMLDTMLSCIKVPMPGAAIAAYLYMKMRRVGEDMDGYTNRRLNTQR